MDLTKIEQVVSVLALLAGVLLRGAALARICSRVSVLAFACVFGQCESQVVTVVTKIFNQKYHTHVRICMLRDHDGLLGVNQVQT